MESPVKKEKKMNRNNYPNLSPTKISVPKEVRGKLFKDGHVFILHNLMEDSYFVHLYEENKEPEFCYLENDYNNDDLSHVNYISYEVPEPYTSVFEVYEVYEYDSNSKSMRRIFYREEDKWQEKIEVLDIEPGMFVVVKYDTEKDPLYALPVFCNDGDVFLVYNNGCFDRWNTVKRKTKEEQSSGIVLFIGQGFNCYDSVRSYLNCYYKNEKVLPYITGEPTFIHPYFHELYECYYKEE